MNARAALAYKNVSLDSASPVRVLDEVFVRLLRDCQEAIDRIKQGDVAGKGESISHALGLIAALASALERDRAPELCDNLSRLYQFAHERLVEANAQMDPVLVTGAQSVLTTLKQAFGEAAAR